MCLKGRLNCAVGRSYDRVMDNRYSRALSDTRVVYSVTDWRKKAKRLKTTTPFDVSISVDSNQKKESIVEKRGVDCLEQELKSELEEEKQHTSLTNKEIKKEREDFIDTEEKCGFLLPQNYALDRNCFCEAILVW